MKGISRLSVKRNETFDIYFDKLNESSEKFKQAILRFHYLEEPDVHFSSSE